MGTDGAANGGAGPGESEFAGRTAIALLAALNAAVLVLVAHSAAYPYPLDVSDGGVLSSAWHIVSRGPIYNEIKGPPYVFNIHNPIFIHLSALVFYLFGPHAAGPRLLAEAMLLGTAVFVYLAVMRLTGSRSAALIAALFLPVSRYFVRRVGMTSCDYAALFFTMMGAYYLVREGRWIFAAAAAFVLAYFSKQSAVITPVAVLAMFIFTGRRRDALSFGMTWAAGLAVGFGICHLIWGKAFFLDTILAATVTSFSYTRGAVSAATLFVHYPMALAAAAWAAARSRTDKRLAIVTAYIASGLINAYLSGNEGAHLHYLYGLSAAAALAGGVFWPVASAGLARARGRVKAALAAALIIQGALVIEGVVYRYDEFWTRAVATAQSNARSSLYDTAGGIVLDEFPGWDLGKASVVFSTDTHRLSQIIKAGVLPRDTLVRLARDKAFTAVVMPHKDEPWGFFTDELKAAVRENYQLAGGSENLEFYVPAGGAAVAPEGTGGDASLP